MKSIRLRGVNIVLDRDDPYFTHDRAAIFQVFFAGEYDRILNSIHTGDTVIDAGANIGCFTLLAAKKVGSRGRVISIEPGPSNYKKLESNIAVNGFRNVVPINAALDIVSRVSRPFREGGVDGQFDEKGNISVMTTTIPEVLKAIKVERVSSIKMDIEGAEELVFQENGIERVIEEVDSLAIEVHSESALKLIEKKLREHDFFVSPIYTEGRFISCLIRSTARYPFLAIGLYRTHIFSLATRVASDRFVRKCGKFESGILYATKHRSG
jgi:FkbM family methyltransferase